MRTLVGGIDMGTQSTKVVVCDAHSGEVLREGRAPHPDATDLDPRVWWEALRQATSGDLLRDVSAIGVAGQQHGMVALDSAGATVRPALLWNDLRSASAAADLTQELGGPSAWADAVGTVPVASLTITKLRWLAEHEPELAARVDEVVLPHDWLTAAILGDGAVRPQRSSTDRGDASGTGYWSARDGDYRWDLLERAFGRRIHLPTVLEPDAVAGETSTGVLVSAGTGDNMAAGLGLGLELGDVVVSLGTSGTAFARHDRPSADSSGAVAGFADATGLFLPLVCTLNAARVLTATATMLRMDLAELDAAALAADPGAGGLVMLPYLDGERTPDLPGATGVLSGLTRSNGTPQNVARAAVEGMISGLADGVDALRAAGVSVRRVLLIGGAARSASVQAVAGDLLGVPVVVPPPGEYVALGGARQAALALATARGSEPPAWLRPGDLVLTGARNGAAERRRAYMDLRNTVHPTLDTPGGRGLQAR